MFQDVFKQDTCNPTNVLLNSPFNYLSQMCATGTLLKFILHALSKFKMLHLLIDANHPFKVT